MKCSYDFLGTWNGHFSHLLRLYYGCKIECIQRDSKTPNGVFLFDIQDISKPTLELPHWTGKKVPKPSLKLPLLIEK